VAALRATVLPRITIAMTGVTVGSAPAITIDAIDVGTDLRALLSRRIEHASLRINGARVTLPLPRLAFTASGAASAGAPVSLVSIDEVVLKDIQIVSRGRTLRGDIELVPHGTSAVTVRQIALTADAARIEGVGEITDLAGPVGTLDLKGGALDLDQLIAFASDFAAGSTRSTGGSGLSAPATGANSRPDLTVAITADSATMAGVSMQAVSARARLTGTRLQAEPVAFNLFGGRYDGTLGADFAGEQTFSWKAELKDVDMAAVSTFAGKPGLITGRLAAQVALAGQGIDAARAMKSARGTAAITIASGTVQNLALVKAALAAIADDPQAAVAASQGPHDEPFTEFGANLLVANGTASTQDLHFISKDIRLDAAGALKLDGSAISLKGEAELSEELTKQAGTRVARMTERDGRIHLPVSVTGVAGRYSLEIDTAALLRRAVANQVRTQTTNAIKAAAGRIRK
jgi:hypothetical protein